MPLLSVLKNNTQYNTSYADKDNKPTINGKETYTKGYIINTPYNSVSLPATGASGTKLYYLLGLLLLALAGVGVTVMRKKRA